MKTVSLGMLLLALCVALLAVLAACNGEADADQTTATETTVAAETALAPDQALALVQDNCARCHPLQRTCDKLGFKDAAQWRDTVTRMVDKGAGLTQEQIGPVSDYLAGLASGDAALCR